MNDNEQTKPTKERTQEMCDLIVTRAAEMMMGEAMAPVEMIVDRLVTYATAQTVNSFGKDDALKMLRGAIQAVEGGAFDHVDPSLRPH